MDRRDDSLLDSFLSDASRKKKAVAKKLLRTSRSSKAPVSTEYTERLDKKIDLLTQQKEQLVKDMMVQCKVNECRFDSLIQKKRKEREIKQEIQTMNQEFLLMKKQIQLKERAAKEFSARAAQAKQMNEVKERWRKQKEEYRARMEELHCQNRTEGKLMRETSHNNKLKRLNQIAREKNKSYRIIKEKSREAALMKSGEFSQGLTENIIKAKENKIKLKEGSISKRDFLRLKLRELDSQISARIEKHDQGFVHMQGDVRELVQSQVRLRQELERISQRMQEEVQNLTKQTKLSQEQVRVLKKPILNYNFNKFDEKANKLKFLFSEDKANNKASKESEMNTKRSIEDSLNRIHLKKTGGSTTGRRPQDESLV